MPKLNVDEIKQLAEPIEIILDGKTYIVEKISVETLKAVEEAGKDRSVDAPVKQLAIFVGVSPDELKGIDLRKIGRAIAFITEALSKDIDQLKNASGAEAKS